MTHSSEVRRAAFVLLGGGCSARRVGTLLGVSRSQVSQWRLDTGGVIKTGAAGKSPLFVTWGPLRDRPAPRASAGGAGDRQTAGLGCLDGVAGVATQRRQPRRAVRRSAGAGLSAGAGASADAGPSAAAQTVEAGPLPSSADPGCSTGWMSMTHPSRSLAGCAWSSVTMSRCRLAAGDLPGDLPAPARNRRRREPPHCQRGDRGPGGDRGPEGIEGRGGVRSFV